MPLNMSSPAPTEVEYVTVMFNCARCPVRQIFLFDIVPPLVRVMVGSYSFIVSCIKPDAFTADPWAVSMPFCYNLQNFLNGYVQNPFYQILATFLVVHYLQEHVIIGEGQRIPINFIIVFQIGTCLSDRHNPSAPVL